MNLFSTKFKITKLLLVCAIGILPLLSFPVTAEVVGAGSAKANSSVDCVPGSEQRDPNNWVRACVLLKAQGFNRVTNINPGYPSTTEPVNCAANTLATFDEYGWLVSCQ